MLLRFRRPPLGQPAHRVQSTEPNLPVQADQGLLNWFGCQSTNVPVLLVPPSRPKSTCLPGRSQETHYYSAILVNSLTVSTLQQCDITFLKASLSPSLFDHCKLPQSCISTCCTSTFSFNLTPLRIVLIYFSISHYSCSLLVLYHPLSPSLSSHRQARLVWIPRPHSVVILPTSFSPFVHQPHLESSPTSTLSFPSRSTFNAENELFRYLRSLFCFCYWGEYYHLSLVNSRAHP